jgi:hypothetical protein
VVLADASLSDLLPDIKVEGRSSVDLVRAEYCYFPPQREGQFADPTLITVTAIDLKDPEKQVSRSIVGPTETVYVSTESLYLATVRHEFCPWFESPGVEVAPDDSVPPETTELHKFALLASGPAYRGSGSVPGHLGWEANKKFFRMSEYEGTLRIATSLGQTWNDTSTTRLSLLQETPDPNRSELTEIAYLTNIGETGERLYAARFVGDRGYLVTFRMTDPLYVFDLSDPSLPKKMGELHIEGYSDYLHPISPDFLLGIGKDAVPDASSSDFGGRGAWYQGVKLSLFDVSDMTNPGEMDALVIGKRGTESDALFDHHALAYLPPSEESTARLALPIKLHDTVPTNGYYFDPDEPWSRYQWTHTGLYLFDIKTDEEPQISLRGTMVVETRDDVECPDCYREPGADRSVLLDDSVHYVHDASVWSATWGDTKDMTGPR